MSRFRRCPLLILQRTTEPRDLSGLERFIDLQARRLGADRHQITLKSVKAVLKVRKLVPRVLKIALPAHFELSKVATTLRRDRTT